MARFSLLPLVLLASGLGAGAASAQTAPLSVRVRPEAPPYQDVHARAAASGPVVLQVGPGAGFGSGLPVRAIPIASISNGAAFGPTGYGYFSDSVSEGPLDRRLPPRTYYLGSFPR
ncbi:MAG: hypothetical protein PGN34_14970 [Methylobacterium frigidaeris]